MASVITRVSDGMGFRRPIALPEPAAKGYMMLKAGDLIQKGDEYAFLNRDNDWVPTMRIGHVYDPASMNPHRRPLPAATAIPEGLPPLPPVPEGYSRWEYRGKGWRSEGLVVYGIDSFRNEWAWDMLPSRALGLSTLHYIELIK
jgi:hypothetical protein